MTDLEREFLEVRAWEETREKEGKMLFPFSRHARFLPLARAPPTRALLPA